MIAETPEAPGVRVAPPRESAYEVLERERRRILRRKWIAMLTLPPIAALLAFFVTLSLPPVYEAEGLIRMTHGLGRLNYGGPMIWEDFADEIALLSTREFKLHVLAELSPEQRALLASQQSSTAVPTRVRDSRTIGTQAERTTVLPTGVRITGDSETALLRIADDNRDPRLAAALVNATIRASFRSGPDTAYARGRNLRVFLTPRIAALKTLIARQQRQEDDIGNEGKGQADITSEQFRVGTLYVPRDIRKPIIAGSRTDRRDAITFAQPPAQSTFQSIASAAGQARLDERLQSAQVDLLATFAAQDPQSLDAGRENPVLFESLRSLQQARAAYAQLGATLGPSHPEMTARIAEIQTLERQVETLRRRGLTQARASLRQTRLQAHDLDEQQRRERAAVDRILAAQQASALLEVDLAVNLTLLADLEQKLREYPLAAGLDAPVVEVVDYAMEPIDPLAGSLLRNTVGGLTAGLALAFAVIAWLQLRARRRWSFLALENAAGRPILALIQQATPAAGPVLQAPQFADPLRQVRSALHLLRGPRASLTVAFTSSRPGEGTSTIVTALATLLAASGERVLMLDANLHRPALHRLLNLPAEPGLSQLLTGSVPLLQAAQRVAVPGSGTGTGKGKGTLDVVTAGPPAPVPAALLQSASFDELLRQTQRLYTYILLDTAPAGAPAGKPATTAVDATFLIARYDQVDLHQIRHTERLLQTAPFTAVIANAIPPGRLLL